MPNQDSSRPADGAEPDRAAEYDRARRQRRDWLQWCDEKSIRAAARKDAVLNGHVSYSSAVQRWPAIYCQACKTRHI